MYSQILICASLLIAAYQDIRYRSVNDIVWLPAAAGAGIAFMDMYSNVQFYDFKIVLVVAIGVAFTYLGQLGQADLIGYTFLGLEPTPLPLSPILPLLFFAVVFMGHLAFEFSKGNVGKKKTIPIERFLKEMCWIPKAVIAAGGRREVSKDVNVARDEVEANPEPGSTVEVTYGVPTVAYLGIGYTLFLVYLLVFNLPLFLSLP